VEANLPLSVIREIRYAFGGLEDHEKVARGVEGGGAT
jgi:hypothetical protein